MIKTTINELLDRFTSEQLASINMLDRWYLDPEDIPMTVEQAEKIGMSRFEIIARNKEA